MDGRSILMKKITALIIAVCMGVSLTACGGSSLAETHSTASQNSQSEENAEVSDIVTETAGNNETQEADSSFVQTTESEKNVLVAYFSATGTTEGVTQEMASVLSADLYEIAPEEPYTDADLNYNDDNSRSTIEMNDTSARPAAVALVPVHRIWKN